MTANTSLLLLCIFYTIFLKVSGTPLPIEGKKTTNSKPYFKWPFNQKEKKLNLNHLINHMGPKYELYCRPSTHHLGTNYYVNFLGHLGSNGFQLK